jgi:hypothetical protein
MSEPKNSSTTSETIPPSRQLPNLHRIPAMPAAWGSARYPDPADRARAWREANPATLFIAACHGQAEQAEWRQRHDLLVLAERRTKREASAAAASAASEQAARLRQHHRWPLLVALHRARKINIAPRGLAAAVKRFAGTAAEERLIDGMAARMAGTAAERAARRAGVDPLAEPVQARRDRRWAARAAAHVATFLDDVRTATVDWSMRRTTVEAGPASVWYEHVVEWARSGWCKRHNKPAAVYDVLHVRCPLGTAPRFDRDGSRCREITIGAWTWRKLRGHSLAVRYQSQGPEADRAEFAATANTEMRAAITVVSSDHVESLLDARLLQADDYGRLYQTAVGRMVRVVCPSTGRTHWLRADPHAETAHAAVAASFGMTVREYGPEEQH